MKNNRTQKEVIQERQRNAGSNIAAYLPKPPGSYGNPYERQQTANKPQHLRPDSEGWWWRLCKGEWECGKAEYIQWEDAGEPEQERVLAWSRGGCYTRCDQINLRLDSGTRWFKATPPILDSENTTSPSTGATEKDHE